jgi:hypothetical protein
LQSTRPNFRRRHGHLMLFDDGDQLEVRHVISLAHHSVSIYSGGDETPEGELFIKRNAICLSRKTNIGELTPDGKVSKPFFLFSENCSDKEDFYFALLRNQERKPNSKDNPPTPLQYDVKDIITLVQRLHSSEEHLQTRWINAVIGRVFLALYKTPEVENFLRAKITKKISRVKTPSFLSKIALRHIDMGEAAPVVTNPRLKDLTADGELIVEADVRYMGNFRIEVAATARIELGTRIKAREVNLLLAVVVKRVDGHAMVRIKPPPSNRFWVTFQSMPKIDMTIEPIVSSRQITYTVILRQIENRIKEVVAESLVFPNWDDFPFYHTYNKLWRGGIWVEDMASGSTQTPEDPAAQDGDVGQVQRQEMENDEAVSGLPPVEKSISMPLVDMLPSSTAFSRKGARSSLSLGTTRVAGSSTSVETRSSERPRGHQLGGSLASTPPQDFVADVSQTGNPRGSSPPNYNHSASAVASVASASQTSLPIDTLSTLPPQTSKAEKDDSQSSTSSLDSTHSEKDFEKDFEKDATVQPPFGELYPTKDPNSNFSSQIPTNMGDMSLTPEAPSAETLTSVANDPSRENSSSTSGKSSAVETKRLSLAAVTNAAATAKKWGWNAIQRHSDAKSGSSKLEDGPPLPPRIMGRGRPLPPPGIPLPPPDRQSRTVPIAVPKRKPVMSPALTKQQKDSGRESSEIHTLSSVSPIPLRSGRSQDKLTDEGTDDSLLVVAAPAGDSEPSTPSSEHAPPYQPPWAENTINTEEGDETRENMAAVRDIDTAQLYKRRLPHRVLSTSPEEDGPKLPSWMAAQEEEARTKSTFVDEDIGL